MLTMNRFVASLSLVALIGACLGLVGCVEVSSQNIPDWVPDAFVPEPTTVETDVPPEDQPSSSGWSNGVDTHGREMPYGTHGHGTEVLLLGRSVMAGLFDHWGWDWQSAVNHEGYAFYYGELESPPAIADSAVEYVDNVPGTTVVCFKLCFVDFWARSSGDADANLQENLDYVRTVADAAQQKGVRLVLMTALPETSANTNAALVDLHLRYNEGVREIAAGHEGVYVYDIHGLLADNTGALHRGFAASPTDAHLSEVAYLELDEDLLRFLDATFAD